MKKLISVLVLLLFIGKISFSQTMLDVATGEYSTQYVKSDGTVWATFSTVYDVTWAPTQVSGLSNIVQCDGGQYTSVFLDNAGRVYSSVGQSNTSTAYPTDNTGATFSGCSKAYAMWRMIVAIKSGEVWYWSAAQTSPEDMLLQFSSTLSTPVPKPRKLIQPPGKTIVKCVFGSGISPYASGTLWGLASDGTLWQWDQTHTTPFQLTGRPGFPAKWTGQVVDAACGPDISMVVTSTNEVWCWGFNGGNYGGHYSWENADMTNIAPNMTAAGVTFPLKQIMANYVCVEAIDNNNNKFGIGNNQTGALGSGYMSPSWATNWNGTNSNIYAYSYTPTEGLQATWMQLPGKWKSIKTNSSFVFYTYGQDMAGNWYSWGRNKGECLGQGETFKVVDQANFPDWEDIPAPRLINPITQTWTIDPSVVTSTLRKPIANAGINQYLAGGTTSTTLYGSGSHQQQPTNALTITMTNQWTLKSGPNTPTITNPASQNTTVTGLTGGTYVFRNTVTNSKGASDYQEVTVLISGTTNINPIAKAGPDQVITLPTNTTNLNGSGSSDPDGTISSYAWSQVSGPTTASIAAATSATTSITGLKQGVYVFLLKVTDNRGASNSDSVKVTVNPAAVNQPPVAKAGADTVINGYLTVPGKVEAAVYDAMSGVQTQSTSDIGGGLNVDYINNGDWMDYNLAVSGTGNYSVGFRIAAPATGSQIQLKNSNGTVLTTINIPATGGWQTWTTVTANLTLTSGNQTLRLQAVVPGTSFGFNINWMQFALVGGSTSSPAISEYIKVNVYGGSNPYNDSEWNNWNVGSAQVSNVSSGPLKYADGTSSTASANLSSSVAVADNGTGYSGTLAPDQVLRYTSYATANRTLTLSGLSVSKKYNLELYASRGQNSGNSTLFIINGTTQTIPTFDNVTQKASFTNLSSDAQGNITVSISQTSQYNYLNGFMLTENTNSTSASTAEVVSSTITEESLGDVKESAQVYPNPVADMFVLKINNSYRGTFNIVIYDVNGSVMKEISAVKDQDNFQKNYNLGSNFKSGNYYIKLVMGKQSKTIKILKL